MRYLCSLLFLFSLVGNLSAEVQTKSVTYQDGDVQLVGFVAWDDTKASLDGARKAPGILIVHQWLGLTDYEKSRAQQLASLGYVAFALDIYGEGNKPESVQTAGAVAGKFKADRDLFRRRLNLGLEQLKSLNAVNSTKVAAIGYCFGGTGAIELARSGADIRGLVSFHGGLDSPNPDDGKNIQAKILVCHGADDPFMTADDIDAFKSELNEADVDWQMIYYSNAVHSFTQPMAGNDNSRGAAYNELADNRSWEAMRVFFDEIFAE